MNLKITEDNISRAAGHCSSSMPITRTHWKGDWTSEAYIELQKRIGKPYWSSINWTRATLRRRYGQRQDAPKAEADLDDYYHDCVDYRGHSPLDLNIAHEADTILCRLSKDADTYRVLNDLLLTTKQKAVIIGHGDESKGHGRIRWIRRRLAESAASLYPDLVPGETVSRYSS